MNRPIATRKYSPSCPHCGAVDTLSHIDTEFYDALGLHIIVSEEGEASVRRCKEGVQGVRIGLCCRKCGQDSDITIGERAWEPRPLAA